jgi:hypothetical protein
VYPPEFQPGDVLFGQRGTHDHVTDVKVTPTDVEVTLARQGLAHFPPDAFRRVIVRAADWKDSDEPEGDPRPTR